MSFLNFVEQPNTDGRKTKVWKILSGSSNGILGSISFYPQWRKYVFFPVGQTCFDDSCLTEISTFLTAETSRWRYAKKT